jgi:hypothetical protein
MWDEVIVARFKTLSTYLPGDRENMKIQSSPFTGRYLNTTKQLLSSGPRLCIIHFSSYNLRIFPLSRRFGVAQSRSGSVRVTVVSSGREPTSLARTPPELVAT